MSGDITLRLSQDTEADALLGRNPFALLVGMLLDQQFPMERAFGGPYKIATRLGRDLDPADVARLDPSEFAALFAQPPAVHRYPGAMAGRVQALGAYLTENHDGNAADVWNGAADGRDLRDRIEALPGFGQQKARILVALLGKQLGVTPKGWRDAAGPYGENGAHRSIADVTGPESLTAVRADKQERKAAKKAAVAAAGPPDAPATRG